MAHSDRPGDVAFDAGAPADERRDAHTQLAAATVPSALSDLIPREDLAPVIDYIREQYAEAALAKSAQVIPFPGRPNDRKTGMQSVYLDGLQIYAHGDYFERPSPVGYESLRLMVEQTPVLNAVIMTRIRQVHRFCNPQDDDGPGFVIRHIDKDHAESKAELESRQLLTKFIQHCGWEFNPRARKRLRRDNFSQFIAKLTRESLTYDAAPIETELKQKRSEGIDGFYALDGSTIRLCTEEGYRGDDEVFAVQVVQGQIVTAYSTDDLIYEARNPRADVRLAGYGMGETELLIRVVTGWLNAMNFNLRGFDNNAIPKGILHLVGEYSQDDLVAFRRLWNAMVKGVNNAWALPMMVSRTPESKATYERIDNSFTDLYFAKWMTFLTSVVCAIYGMSPAEINFDSFTAGNTSALSGSDTSEKMAASRDSGLRPLMAYLESTISDFIIADFSDKYVFRWTGLDEEDQEKRHELRKAVMTVNEIRAQEGLEALEGPLGEAPINPALVGPWMQLSMGGGDEGAGDDDEATPGTTAKPQQDGSTDTRADDEGAGPQKDATVSADAAREALDEVMPERMQKADAPNSGRSGNPNHDPHTGQFARSPDVRYEKRQLHELYNFTLKHPLAAPDAMLVNLKADDLAVEVDKGPAVESVDGQIKVTGRKGPGRGHGMVKVLWKHGQRSGKPDDERVTRGDVLALPEVVRSTPTVIVMDEADVPRAWEWRRKRFDGAIVVYAASRFTDTDNRNHVVTIHVDRDADMKKAAGCAAGDLFGRTPPLPAGAVSVPASAVRLLTVQYWQNLSDVKVEPAESFGSVVPEIWRIDG